MKIKKIAAVVLSAAMAMTSISFAAASTKPVDGTYKVKLNTVASGVYNYKMFCVNHEEDNYGGTLTVKNGKMTVRFRLTGTGYDYLYPGTAEQAAAADESEWINHESVMGKDSEGNITESYYYNFPITKTYIYESGFKDDVGVKLDNDTKKATEIMNSYAAKSPISGHSKKRNAWYGAPESPRALLVYVQAPGKTSISKVKAGKKRATVYIRKNTKSTSGYQIRYSKKKSMKGARTVTISSNKTTKKTIKKLSRGTRYYFQVRTYNQVAKKIYSKWSTKKSVKIK